MHHQKAVLCFYLNGMIEQNVLREKTEVRIQENIKIRRRDICMSSLEKCLFSLKNKKFKKKKKKKKKKKRQSESIKDVTEKNQESRRKKGKNGFTETKRMREFSGMVGNVFSFSILFSPFNLCC